MNIFKKLRAAPETSSAIREAIREVEAALPAAAATLATAEAERAALLLSGTDREIIEAENQIAMARIALDRLRAAAAELARRLDATEIAEFGAALDAERAMVEARAAKIAARLRPEYEKSGAAIVALLADLGDAEAAVQAVNAKIREAGRTDAVTAVEERVIGAGASLLDVVSLRSLTSIRPVGACAGWGGGRHVAEVGGLPR